MKIVCSYSTGSMPKAKNYYQNSPETPPPVTDQTPEKLFMSRKNSSPVNFGGLFLSLLERIIDAHLQKSLKMKIEKFNEVIHNVDTKYTKGYVREAFFDTLDSIAYVWKREQPTLGFVSTYKSSVPDGVSDEEINRVINDAIKKSQEALKENNSNYSAMTYWI